MGDQQQMIKADKLGMSYASPHPRREVPYKLHQITYAAICHGSPYIADISRLEPAWTTQAVTWSI